MRLNDLAEELENIFDLYPHLKEYGVKVTLDGNEFSIDRVEPGPDGVLIILETYSDYDLEEAKRNGRC